MIAMQSSLSVSSLYSGPSKKDDSKIKNDSHIYRWSCKYVVLWRATFTYLQVLYYISVSFFIMNIARVCLQNLCNVLKQMTFITLCIHGKYTSTMIMILLLSKYFHSCFFSNNIFTNHLTKKCITGMSNDWSLKVCKRSNMYNHGNSKNSVISWKVANIGNLWTASNWL